MFNDHAEELRQIASLLGRGIVGEKGCKKSFADFSDGDVDELRKLAEVDVWLALDFIDYRLADEIKRREIKPFYANVVEGRMSVRDYLQMRANSALE